MAVLACLLLLLSISIAGQAIPFEASLATDLQDGLNGGDQGRATGKEWLYMDRNKPAPLVRRGTAELDEVLFKRMSGSPSHRRWSHRRQSAAPQPVPPNRIQPGVPPAPHVVGT